MSDDRFEPMPLHALDEMTIEQLLEEHHYASKIGFRDYETTKRYCAMIDAIARFRFPEDHWDMRVLYRLTTGLMP